MLHGTDRTCDDNFEFQFTDQNPVAGLQNRLTSDALAIDKCAIRTSQVAQADTEIIQREDTVVTAHRFAGGTKLAIVFTSDQKPFRLKRDE